TARQDKQRRIRTLRGRFWKGAGKSLEYPIFQKVEFKIHTALLSHSIFPTFESQAAGVYGD
ncbi:MAG: hypothetical protein ACI4QC_02145, partial [Thermoguttaceae bacterium]